MVETSIRILLLQARVPGDPERAGEARAFARRCRLAEESIRPHDLLDGPPSLEAIRRHDAVMVGGAGDFYVSKGDLPHFEATLDRLRELVDVGHPTFASCFGFQLLTRALGGEIVHDPESTEVGTYPVELTVEGAEDPLFGALPSPFWAQLGRKDRARQLPASAVRLARSERCPHQAFRLSGRPIWASQFHPELDEEENRGRYYRYLEGYAQALTPEEQEEVLERFRASPDTEGLLCRFLDLVFD